MMNVRPLRFELHVPKSVWNEVLEHCQSCLPFEACGMLLGKLHAQTGEVTHPFPLRNDLQAEDRFLTNPHDMLAMYRLSREEQLTELAFYHSHPRSAPLPSMLDLAENSYGTLVQHVIISFENPQPTALSWWLQKDEFQAAPWQIV